MFVPRGVAEAFVPDGRPLGEALARISDLAIVAHPDDLELLAVAGIGACVESDDRWFGGVVVTDGAGGAIQPGPKGSPTDLVDRRAEEQRVAARLGGYSVVVMLGHTSAHVRSPLGQDELVEQLVEILETARPVNLYTHNLADKHHTHVAVGSAALKAVRHLPMPARPTRMVGVEGWRDLDWLLDADKVRMDVTEYADLAQQLAAVFTSQLEGKRYDLAARGRRHANATFFEPRAGDVAEQVIVAMDLTPLARNDDIDPLRFVTSAIERFRDDAEGVLAPYW